ncbi:MAG TPA: HmuY family protein, partial [Polyangiaceae bacterium]|nr:HmuY family protein [Polyangiaceae bacterium]
MDLERIALKVLLTLLCSTACANEARKNDAVMQGGAGAGGLGSADELPGNPLTVEVRDDQPVYLDLSVPRVVEPNAPAESTGWDLALQGWEIFTNSGPSGPGAGGSFGPTDELAFLSGTAPEVPFLREDTTGGAFLEWYAYDGTTHSLYSRFHVYGVRSREKLYKLQLLGYYCEQLGAPVSALYSLRYVRASPSGSDELVTIESLDATAGGPNIDDDQPSGCLVLATAAVQKLTPAEARTSDSWDLCFRRDTIAVNGERGGPGTVSAVDLQGEETAREELDRISELTPESELARFESV